MNYFFFFITLPLTTSGRVKSTSVTLLNIKSIIVTKTLGIANVTTANKINMTYHLASFNFIQYNGNAIIASKALV